ncbi:hypothetical protein ACFWBH_01185 [Streptomyces sp. NPDC059999]|uniref:hypothetical protein n=1 Tax=Streptomyces sp. NPDC059999 TaxID=3347030 RepID=UPI0036A58304
MIVQLYGEWAERAQDPKDYAGAVAGCQAHADTVVRSGTHAGKQVRRAIVNKGLALYIDIPDAFFFPGTVTVDGQAMRARQAELRINDPFDGHGILTATPEIERKGRKVEEFLRHPGRYWTDGLVTAPEEQVRRAIDLYWLGIDPNFDKMPEREQYRIKQMVSQPPTVEDISGFIDYGKCTQSGNVLVVEADQSYGFEDTDDQYEELPFLVALYDPQYYHLPFSGPYGSLGANDAAERDARIRNQKPPKRLGWNK